MADDNRSIRLITFRVGPELFVLDIMTLRQIVPYTGSTPVPRAPAFLEGIVIVRNEVIPVIDLRSRLYPELPPPEKPPLVLITDSPAGVLGLKVDEIRRLIRVDTQSILPPPPLIRSLQGDLFIGVIEQGEEVYLVLDLETLLTVDEQKTVVKVREIHETLVPNSSPEGR
ncbi:MAG TPA: chemotaxis protein CheW [Thermoanaerobaculia bacterium]|nr:chemotaxis protein CheW [Thermoanaerobaculia bacterium]